MKTPVSFDPETVGVKPNDVKPITLDEIPCTSTSAKSPAVKRASSHERTAVPLPEVNARFLPFDDFCSVNRTSRNCPRANCEAEWAHEHGSGLLQGERDIHTTRQRCLMAGSGVTAAVGDTEKGVAPGFMKVLRDTISETQAEGAEVSKESVRKSWSAVFGQWPLELAASGYAEWWLRHPFCDQDATHLFQTLIEGVAREECRRNSLVDTKSEDELCPGVPQGALLMLHALYTDPPQSLEVAFSKPLCHQQLFFRTCRLGALGDERELTLCLALAATLAQRIAGNKLAMRHDLIRFLGRVRREWQVLKKNWHDENKLAAEVAKVEALLPFALD
uniref:Uncharacterized protein n=1 Tax=Trypanosoma congolense (strain IL3000) TaxID=1068625 RepID=G0UZX9_TRYCI|nr:conserved hypothetical protein [Trypanosoma congolense IL3000]